MKKPFPKYNIAFQNSADSVLDIYLDGVIVDADEKTMREYYLGEADTSVSYSSFRDHVLNYAPKVLNVYVNSPGGDVSSAMAIRDFLVDQESRGIKVNRIGRGRIASAGTYILMGNNSEMSENSMMMIHNVSFVAFGNIDEIESQARAGRKFNNLIRDFYVRETGLRPEDISKLMSAETWFTAEEAKAKGFVKNVSGKVKFTNHIAPETWPYSNTTVLNMYNAEVNEAEENSESILSVLKNDLLFLKNEIMKFKDLFSNNKVAESLKNVTIPANATHQEIVNILTVAAGVEIDKRLENLGDRLDEQVNENGNAIKAGFENQLAEAKSANDALQAKISGFETLVNGFKMTVDNLTKEATGARGGETKPKNETSFVSRGKFAKH